MFISMAIKLAEMTQRKVPMSSISSFRYILMPLKSPAL